jgi:pyruvate/2-oxoglutarate dehydrogenase complex dihydrolipoamide acyltransferase (E2) component
MLGLSGAAMCLLAAGAAAQGTGTAPSSAAPAPAATAPAPAATAAAPAAAATPRTPSPHDAYVYIGWPLDGATVYTTHVKVWFGTRNFGVAPAGVTTKNTGHHHLLIDAPVPPLGEPIPSDRNHLHFGLGQTEAIVELTPGTHTLQLLMGDADHVPHDPPLMSRRITIHVRAVAGQ